MATKAAKRATLDDALDEVTPASAAPAPVVEVASKPAPIPSREGTSLVGAHLPNRFGKAMKLLSAETDKSQRELLEEAITMLMVKYGSRHLDV